VPLALTKGPPARPTAEDGEAWAQDGRWGASGGVFWGCPWAIRGRQRLLSRTVLEAVLSWPEVAVLLWLVFTVFFFSSFL
jgi:hypothetical protein